MNRRMNGGRRAFLRAAGAAGIAGLATPAAAFRLVPAEDYAGVVRNACGAEAALHRQVLAEAERALGVALDGPRAEEARRALASLTCPNCGCGVLAELTGIDPGGTSGDRAPF
jgi:hypothetical protein